jgi:hypothetical protein
MQSLVNNLTARHTRDRAPRDGSQGPTRRSSTFPPAIAADAPIRSTCTWARSAAPSLPLCRVPRVQDREQRLRAAACRFEQLLRTEATNDRGILSSQNGTSHGYSTEGSGQLRSRRPAGVRRISRVGRFPHRWIPSFHVCSLSILHHWLLFLTLYLLCSHLWCGTGCLVTDILCFSNKWPSFQNTHIIAFHALSIQVLIK